MKVNIRIEHGVAIGVLARNIFIFGSFFLIGQAGIAAGPEAPGAPRPTHTAAVYLPPRQTPVSPFLPPAGSGKTAPELIKGDAGAPLGPPTGRVDKNDTGSKFETVEEEVQTKRDRYYLKKEGWDTERLIMETPPEDGGKTFTTEKDLEKYNDSHYMYPRVQRMVQINGRASKQIMRDAPNLNSYYLDGRDKPSKDWKATEDNDAPLPTVRMFCRKLVILGVVFATIYMIFAAYSVVLGHRDAGERVVGTAAGLILLLMGYSIYNVVQINAWRYSEGGQADLRELQRQYAKQELQRADTPITPNDPGSRRSNMIVRPLAASKLR